MRYTIQFYEYMMDDFRKEVRVEEGEAWILHITVNGSGYAIDHVPEKGTWREGPEELIGVYTSLQEAHAVLEAI